MRFDANVHGADTPARTERFRKLGLVREAMESMTPEEKAALARRAGCGVPTTFERWVERGSLRSDLLNRAYGLVSEER